VSRDWQKLTGEALRKAAKAADAALADQVVRVRAVDSKFRAALDLSLDIEAEQDRRRNR
jgi:hypothetical protein